MKTRFDGHTPGPWIQQADWIVGAGGMDPEGNGPDTRVTMTAGGVDGTLLAAAPDLLRAGCELAEAMDACVNHCLGCDAHEKMVNEKLAKWRKLVEPKL